MKKKLIKIISTLIILISVDSCIVSNRGIYNTNPCFYLDDDNMKRECLEWRMNYPKEYNAFYDRVKKRCIDTLYKSLPPKVEYIVKGNKAIKIK